MVHLINGTNLGGGGYFNQTTPSRANDQAYDEAARERLGSLAQGLTGGV